MHDIVHHPVPFQTIELFIFALFWRSVLYRTSGTDYFGAVMLLQTLYCMIKEHFVTLAIAILKVVNCSLVQCFQIFIVQRHIFNQWMRIK